METVDAPRLDNSDASFAAWAALAADALEGFDALYVHIKGPDIPAHDGRAVDKRDVISAIDRAFFGEVLQRIDLRDTMVAVTADHSTSCVRKAHTDDPVPLVVAGGRVSADGSPSYGESAAAKGSFGTLMGPEILPIVVGMMRE
jgi:2,3-bisphosphoglycerate-independent phosphoglycerate mutase